MKILIHFVTLFFLFSANESCAPELPGSMMADPPLQQLIIIGEDVSGTFKKHERLHPDELFRLCRDLIQSGIRAAIYIGPIGDPDVKPFLKCDIKAPQVVDQDAPLSERKQQALKRQKDIRDNEMAAKHFINEYVAKIYEREPEQNTDIKGFYDKTEQVFSEPQYAGFQHIHVLHSDGFHDVAGQKDLSPLEKKRFEEVAFYAIGLKNKELVKNLNVVIYESPRAFIDNHDYSLNSINHETEK